ncbi:MULTISPECIES: adenylate/guanylate cyclase domain-containing protein [unclassified Ensifer]|uniref:adenylate/guanylate cyclase domain-containing protein n=1 Tax=unclassified Ensifer TaxID=2633371 RepID=UPI0008130957|nr:MULTISPECIES: adenylate/guanylate cyclase domain-containing protein [unclassified Ensifer]OCO98063.1 adenylate cyclase [Ensifer sp. LC11]OCO98549.1 adenylate cyclase [Ensifer sp. LC13]OCP06205.1 adenylate cyclase [Ensifer sp. LC14]OCP29378.1 adenylate cyclase [Ensifer sp. LC499]
MNCHECGCEIQGGFVFCPNCGAKQHSPCPGCGALCPPHFSFCPTCGTRLGAPATSKPMVSRPRAAATPQARSGGEALAPLLPEEEAGADRRTATILFADLCGFTGLSEQVDPEVLRAFQNELFEELTEAVEAYGGYVDKFIGDALLALFGAPVAHEDDSERALRTALDMAGRARRVGERWQRRIGEPLNLHIGLNTGTVVAGRLGAGDGKAYSVTGDAVNTAQRLQSLAGPGEILVGPVTYRLTCHAFAYEALGAMTLRGKAESVEVYRLTQSLEAPRTARGLEALGLGAPLIGREPEMKRLLDCLELACSGTAQLVRLTGEAGLGKSRLVNEFLERVAADPRFSRVVVRRASSSSLGEPSYGVLAAVLRGAYGISISDSLQRTTELLAAGLAEIGFAQDRLEQLVPLFLRILGMDSQDELLRHVEPEQMRRQLFAAVRVIFERRLSRTPLLLVIEDLHWADAASLEAISFVLERTDGGPLMLLTTQRPDADADRLKPGHTNLTALRLAPLSEADRRRLLATFFGGEGLPQALAERILARAGGNPLFIEEIVRGLIDVSAVQKVGSVWRVVEREAAADIPVTIEAMLLGRVDRLLPDARRLLHHAAMIGPRFDADLLQAVSGRRPVDALLDLLCDAEIIEETRDGGLLGTQTYRFTQTLLQEVVYNNLLLSRRTDEHALIGEVLERRFGEDTERLEEMALLGHHFGLSEQKAKGAHYLIAAGDRARALYANDDAIRLYEQAMAALAATGEEGPEWLAARERVADLLEAAGQREAAAQHYDALFEVYRATGDRVASARIQRKFGHHLWETGRRDEALASFTAAAQLLEGLQAPIESAHLSQERGHLAFRMGDYPGALKAADEALDRVAALASEKPEMQREVVRVTAEALNTKGVALARLGRSVEAIAIVERSVAVAEGADLLNAACRGYTNLAALYTINDPKRAIEVCRCGLDMARRIGDLGFQARLLANLAVAYCTFTDRCTPDGMPAAERAIAIDRDLDQRDHLPVSLLVLGQIHQCHGRPDVARGIYQEALDLCGETQEAQLLFPCYDGLATLCLDAGDLDAAERYFALARDICAQHGLDPEALMILPFLD